MGNEADPISVFHKDVKGAVVFAVDAKGNLPAAAFWKKELKPEERRKFMNLFRRLCSVGKIVNPEQFKHEEDGIYAFKIFQKRLYCFQLGPCWHITNGCTKKKNKADPTELSRAKRIRSEYQARK